MAHPDVDPVPEGLDVVGIRPREVALEPEHLVEVPDERCDLVVVAERTIVESRFSDRAEEVGDRLSFGCGGIAADEVDLDTEMGRRPQREGFGDPGGRPGRSDPVGLGAAGRLRERVGVARSRDGAGLGDDHDVADRVDGLRRVEMDELGVVRVGEDRPSLGVAESTEATSARVHGHGFDPPPPGHRSVGGRQPDVGRSGDHVGGDGCGFEPLDLGSVPEDVADVVEVAHRRRVWQTAGPSRSGSGLRVPRQVIPPPVGPHLDLRFRHTRSVASETSSGASVRWGPAQRGRTCRNHPCVPPVLVCLSTRSPIRVAV